MKQLKLQILKSFQLNFHSNEVIIAITGDSGAVRQAVISGREVGKKLLNALGDTPTSTTEPYI